MISPGALFFLFGIVLVSVTEESFSRVDWFGGGVSTVSVWDCPVSYSIVSSDFAIEMYRATHALTNHCSRQGHRHLLTRIIIVLVQPQ